MGTSKATCCLSQGNQRGSDLNLFRALVTWQRFSNAMTPCLAKLKVWLVLQKHEATGRQGNMPLVHCKLRSGMSSVLHPGLCYTALKTGYRMVTRSISSKLKDTRLTGGSVGRIWTMSHPSCGVTRRAVRSTGICAPGAQRAARGLRSVPNLRRLWRRA